MLRWCMFISERVGGGGGGELELELETSKE